MKIKLNIFKMLFITLCFVGSAESLFSSVITPEDFVRRSDRRVSKLVSYRERNSSDSEDDTRESLAVASTKQQQVKTAVFKRPTAVTSLAISDDSDTEASKYSSGEKSSDSTGEDSDYSDEESVILMPKKSVSGRKRAAATESSKPSASKSRRGAAGESIVRSDDDDDESDAKSITEEEFYECLLSVNWTELPDLPESSCAVDDDQRGSSSAISSSAISSSAISSSAISSSAVIAGKRKKAEIFATYIKCEKPTFKNLQKHFNLSRGSARNAIYEAVKRGMLNRQDVDYLMSIGGELYVEVSSKILKVLEKVKRECAEEEYASLPELVRQCNIYLDDSNKINEIYFLRRLTDMMENGTITGELLEFVNSCKSKIYRAPGVTSGGILRFLEETVNNGHAPFSSLEQLCLAFNAGKNLTFQVKPSEFCFHISKMKQKNELEEEILRFVEACKDTRTGDPAVQTKSKILGFLKTMAKKNQTASTMEHFAALFYKSNFSRGVSKKAFSRYVPQMKASGELSGDVLSLVQVNRSPVLVDGLGQMKRNILDFLTKAESDIIEDQDMEMFSSLRQLNKAFNEDMKKKGRDPISHITFGKHLADMQEAGKLRGSLLTFVNDCKSQAHRKPCKKGERKEQILRFLKKTQVDQLSYASQSKLQKAFEESEFALGEKITQSSFNRYIATIKTDPIQSELLEFLQA